MIRWSSFKIVALTLGMAFVPATFSQTGPETADETPPISLTELATEADLVAVAQVKDTDYVYVRSYPKEGSAFLKVLIAYKRSQAGEDIIEVYEKGLHANECYFENPTVLEEGRRFLVFLRRDPDDPERYRGLAQGCALEILVAQDSRYALKYPVTGIRLQDRLDELARAYQYQDSYALVSDETISPEERNELLAQNLLTPYLDQYKYTHGVDLTTVRGLIAQEAFKPRRQTNLKQR